MRSDGDTDDSYVYRIAITNEATNNIDDRAQAYNVIVRDVLDSSDLMEVMDFATDNLDNDADGVVDDADEGRNVVARLGIYHGNDCSILFSPNGAAGARCILTFRNLQQSEQV